MSVFLFDKNENLIKMIAPEDCYASSQDLEHNGLIKHFVEIPYSPEIDQAMFFGMHDVDNENDFLMYKIHDVATERGHSSLTGIHVFFDDMMADGVIRDYRPANQTAGTVLSQILGGSRWQLGANSATHLASGSFYYQSRLDAFWQYLKTWDVEFKVHMTFSQGHIIGRYVNIADSYAQNFGKWYEIGSGLLTLLAEEERSSIFTAFLGRGKGEESGDGFGRRITFSDVVWSTASGDPVNKPAGQDFVEIPWATDLYGYPEGNPRVLVVEFPDITDPAELLTQTYRAGLLNCIPKRQFSSSVSVQEPAEAGEIVTLIDDSIGVRYQTRIFRLKRDFLNKKKKTFEFGEKIIRSQAERTQIQMAETKALLAEQGSLLAAVRDQIKDAYWNEDGYNYELTAGNEYGLPAGYYSFDRPIDQEPTKVIYVGAGKMLISNSKDPNGEWIWQTAATPEGLVGEAIIANSITASQLSADVGQSLDLSSNVAITSKVSQEDLEIYVGGEVDERISNYSSEVDQRFDSITTTFSAVTTEIGDLGNELQTSLDEISTYIRFDINGIELGELGSPIKLFIENDRIVFKQNDVEVAYIDNNRLYITDGQFLNSLRLGEFAFTPRDNGNLSFGKVT